MGLIIAKCSQCGCNLEIDMERKKNFCPACGAQYIDEKITNNQVTNIQSQTNVYVSGNNQIVKPDIEVLKLLFYSMNFEKLKEKSLNIIEIDKNNSFAKFFYMADFKIVKEIDGFKLVDFQEKAVVDYFVNNFGNLDLKFCEAITNLLMRKVSKFDVSIVFQVIMDNISKLEISNIEKENFLNNIITNSCNLNDEFIEIYYSDASFSNITKRHIFSNDVFNQEIEQMANILNENNTKLAKMIVNYEKNNKDLNLSTNLLLEKYSIEDNNKDTKNGKIDKRGVIIVCSIIFVYIVIIIIFTLLNK